jgi:hypothetical protein
LAAEARRVAVLRPIEPKAFGPELYRDNGFHLNPTGAAAFTERLIPMLRNELGAVVARDTDPPAAAPVCSLVLRATP